jgi:hypothetical protein
MGRYLDSMPSYLARKRLAYFMMHLSISPPKM